MKRVVSVLLVVLLLMTMVPIGTLAVSAASCSEHVYDSACDVECNVCGQRRTISGSAATIDFTILSNRTFYSTSQQVWKQNGIVVTNDKGVSTSNIGDYGGNGYPARFYRSTTVNIEYPGMTKIVIDCSGADAKYVIGWSDSFSADATATVDGSIVTIVLAAPADSFTWEKMSTQTRAYNIAVYTTDHVYDNACDAGCNRCGEIREVNPHIYDNACDPTCNVCETLRAASDHIYDNACDVSCNVCGDIRAIVHSYDNVVIAPTCMGGGYTTYTCLVCGDSYVGDWKSPLGHTYDNVCDAICNVCGAVRKVPDHVYDGVCDAACNECGITRVAPHSYSDVCDRDCNLCGVVRQAPHAYSGVCDDTCNLCGMRRKAGEHTYDHACDNVCNICDAIREVGDSHAYSDTCDRDCNVCGVKREPPHDYDDAYDDTCDTCGAWREVPTLIYGDANGDGKVNNQDLGRLQQYLNGWDVEISSLSMDVDGNGRINNKDLGLLQRYLNGWDVTFG